MMNAEKHLAILIHRRTKVYALAKNNESTVCNLEEESESLIMNTNLLKQHSHW